MSITDTVQVLKSATFDYFQTFAKLFVIMDFPYFSQIKYNEWFSLSRDSKLDKTMPPPSTSHSHQSVSTTTHHQPRYILHDPTPPTTSQNISTTTHHHSPQLKKIHHHPPPPTNSQNISTTIHHNPK